MKRALPFIIIGVILIAGIVGVVLAKNKDNKTTPTNSSTTTPPPASGESPVPTPPAQTSGTEVSITDFKFSPSTLTVKKGTKVTWTNQDSAPHTVTVDSGDGPKSGTLQKGDTYSFTFSTTGSFTYHCAIHSYMTASVTVTE